MEKRGRDGWGWEDGWVGGLYICCPTVVSFDYYLNAVCVHCVGVHIHF